MARTPLSSEVHTPNIRNDKHNTAPIGLFDSGVGGLSVYQHLKQKLPHERYVYYADTLNVPYGARSKEDITRLTLQAVQWLVEAGCKIIVLACNSASAHALYLVRKMYPHVPIVGLVPALKPAVLASRSKKVAVLATQATLNGELLNDVINQFAAPNGVEVTKWFEPALVPWVESGMHPSHETATKLRQQIHVFAQQNIDHLVLGCTHYPFFRDFIAQELTQHQLTLTIIDSGSAIASRVHYILSQHNLLADKDLSNDLQPQTKDIHIDVISNIKNNIITKGDDIALLTSANDIYGGKNSNPATCELRHHELAYLNQNQLDSSAFVEQNTYRQSQKSAVTRCQNKQYDNAKLAFFLTDPKTDMTITTTMLQRLLNTAAS